MIAWPVTALSALVSQQESVFYGCCGHASDLRAVVVNEN
jgi:hypothetical protein